MIELSPTLEDISSPQEKRLLFKNCAMLQVWLGWAKPLQYNVRTGVVNGTPVFEIVYQHSEGS